MFKTFLAENLRADSLSCWLEFWLWELKVRTDDLYELKVVSSLMVLCKFCTWNILLMLLLELRVNSEPTIYLSD